jgi:aerobic-type carbon monoxide dehydrogenase small subunit (CoxS/CutS family)
MRDDPTRDEPLPRRLGRDGTGVSRRSFIQTVGLSAAAGAIAESARAATPAAPADAAAVSIVGPDPIDVELRVNGVMRRLRIDPATTLLEALRFDLDMTGTKEVCDRGACGACSVLLGGRLAAACMTLAIDAEGRDVTTIEGLSDGDRLDPIQTSFIRHDALQCGYCTPGLVVAAKALLNETPRPSLEQIKRGLSGNICRCGTYTNVFNAVLEASGQSPVTDPALDGGAP